MSIMDSIEAPKDRSVIVTICGDAGVGKTSLAAAFPKPIVIRAEDGLQAIPAKYRPKAFPLLQSGDLRIRGFLGRIAGSAGEIVTAFTS